MSYTIDEFKTKFPIDIYFHPLDDGSDRAIFAAKWIPEEFETIDLFIEFYFKYSCIFQAVICGKSIDEAEEWFYPDEQWQERSAKYLSEHSILESDAYIWAKANIPYANIPWLKDYDHSKMLILNENEPDIVAFGEAGFLALFMEDRIE